MNTSLTPVRAEVTLGISRGMIPNFSRASRADSVKGSVSSTSTWTRPPLTDSISRSTLIRVARVCTSGSGTSGLRYACTKTGRSSGSARSSSRVSPESEWSRSAVVSTRKPSRETSTMALSSASATETARTAWWVDMR